MKLNRLILILISTLIIVGCDSYRFNNIIGEYYLVRSESKSDGYRLHYKFHGGYPCVIDTKVVGIGFDDNFLLVKQNYTTISNYYIISDPLKSKKIARDVEFKIGPLSKVEFDKKRKELSIPDTLSLYNIE